jgi:hypothetical protein
MSSSVHTYLHISAGILAPGRSTAVALITWLTSDTHITVSLLVLWFPSLCKDRQPVDIMAASHSLYCPLQTAARCVVQHASIRRSDRAGYRSGKFLDLYSAIALSNLGCDTDYSEAFNGFSQSFQANAGKVHLLGQNASFLIFPNSSSTNHPTIYGI